MTINNQELKYGYIVTFNTVLSRATQPWAGSGSVRKYWMTLPMVKKGCGIFLGWRSLRNGTVLYDSDGFPYFKQDEVVKAAYISPNSRKNPIYADPDSVEMMNNEK